jgi:hypothetical protein
MVPATNASETSGDTTSKTSPVNALLSVAETARTFRSPDGRFHAQVTIAERQEVVPLKSTAFRDWLLDSYRSVCDELPSAYVIGRVLKAIEARARFNASTPPVYIRVGRGGEPGHPDCYIDLANASGQAVIVNAQGWSIVQRPPVHFRHPDGMLPLPLPLRDGSIELLRQYVNVSESEFCLLVGWMAAALMPAGPYPILVIHGEQGSAKSTLARVVRHLIDPQEAPLLTAPRSTRDLMVTAFNGWLLALDNLSALSIPIADALCTLATGGGFSSRRQFTGDLRDVMHAQRPIILNGIDDFVRRADLADRCLTVNPPPIGATSRRDETEFWRSFQADYPAMFGGLLNAVALGLRTLASVQLTELPRMAGFARMGEAVARGLGWPADTFLSAYEDSRRGTTLNALEESVLARVLLDSASLGGLWNWTKSATEMLDELSRAVPARVKSSSRWPQSPRQFSDELRRIAPQLRTRGITVKFIRTPSARLITINADRDFDYSVGPHYTEALRRAE